MSDQKSNVPWQWGSYSEAPKKLTRTSFSADPIRLEKDGLELASGVFIRLPEELANQFPQKEVDGSPPHLTLLYIGDLNRKDFERVGEIVRNIGRGLAPFEVVLDEFDVFTNPEGQQIPCMATSDPVFLKKLHALIRKEVENGGIDVSHIYGPDEDEDVDFEEGFTVHATLDYLDAGVDYEGPKPAGKFVVSNLELWGFGVVRIPMARDARALFAEGGESEGK